MPSSADIGILAKIVELNQRYGLRATDSEVWLHYVNSEKDPDGEGYHYLEFSGTPVDPEKAEKYFKLLEALGLEDGDRPKVGHLSELEDRLDRALSVAPRARVR